MPPSKPVGGRERTSTNPSARMTTKAAPRRSRPSFFGALSGKVSGSPRARAAQFPIHGQSAQAGFFGVQMVAPRSISACAKSPARRAGTRPCREPPDVGLRRREERLDARTAAPPPARHCRRSRQPGRRRRSPRSPPPCRGRCREARQAPLLALRKASAVTLDHRLGAGVEISGARVIAEPGPQLEHVIERRRRQRPHIGPARRESARNRGRPP